MTVSTQNNNILKYTAEKKKIDLPPAIFSQAN
jgi:hypothetical protein